VITLPDYARLAAENRRLRRALSELVDDSEEPDEGDGAEAETSEEGGEEETE
jgi:hypothetical protein